MIKERNNWSTQLSFGRGSGFKARNKKVGADKTSSSLCFADSWYLIFSQFSLRSKYPYKILNFSISKLFVTRNNFPSVIPF